MSEEIHIFASLTAPPGAEDELRKLRSGLVPPTRAEPGNLHYMLHEDTSKAGSFYFFEAYKDQAAADAHISSAYLVKTLTEAEPLLARAPYIHQTKLLAGD